MAGESRIQLERRLCFQTHNARTVAAARLQANEAVLNDVLNHMLKTKYSPKGGSEVTYNTADTVLLAKRVEEDEKLDRVGGGLPGAGDLNLDGNSLVEGNLDVDGGVGGLEGRDGPGPHVLGGSHVGVLKHTGLDVC